MDAGANDGSTSVRMATLKHPLVAVEPLKSNVLRIVHQTFGMDVQAVHGGLGEAAGTGSYPARLDSTAAQRPGGLNQIGLLKDYVARLQLQSGDTLVEYPVLTVDSLMQNQNLSFAHWDVEGAEPAMLRGAAATLARDRPFFTVETHLVSNSTRHAELLRETETAGYRCMQLDEQCGARDCRNLMCVPVELDVPACEHARYVSGHGRAQNREHGHAHEHGQGRESGRGGRAGQLTRPPKATSVES